MPWDTTPEQMEEIMKHAETVFTMLGVDTGDLSEEERKSRERFVGRFGNNR
jgi:hypothetical protein